MVDLAAEQPGPTGHADADEMCSYAIDVWLPTPDLLTDEKAMIEVMGHSAEAGHAVVLGSASYRFPNGVITAVLVLSQSHFSVHTWPEHQSANFDLLTCGRLNGELMLKGWSGGSSRPGSTSPGSFATSPMCPSLAGGPIISGSDFTLAELLSEVAGAVGLAEGDAGVRRVLLAIRQLEPASTRSVSRQTGLPVPVVAAVNNELRARGVVTRSGPVGHRQRRRAPRRPGCGPGLRRHLHRLCRPRRRGAAGPGRTGRPAGRDDGPVARGRPDSGPVPLHRGDQGPPRPAPRPVRPATGGRSSYRR